MIEASWEKWISGVEAAAGKATNDMERGLARCSFVGGFGAGMVAALAVSVTVNVARLAALKEDLLATVNRLEQEPNSTRWRAE